MTPMRSDPRSARAARAVWVFFLLTFAFSWGFWGPPALGGRKPGLLELMAGGSGPTLMGILGAFLFLDREGKKLFWDRALSLRRASGRWWAVAAILFPALISVALVAYRLLGGEPLAARGVPEVLSSPAGMLGFIISMLVAGPLSEEFGWRGFALVELQKRHSPLAASLILGVVWGLWHVPLFLMVDTTQGALGFGTVYFYLFLVQAVALSVIFSWVFARTRESVLVAIVLHFTFNAALALLSGMSGGLPEGLFSTVAFSVIAFAVAIAAMAGPSLLGRPTASRDSSPLNQR